METAGKQTTGAHGESAAAEFLHRNGYRVIQRNYRSKWGEIDIVCRRGSTVVFVEVKTKKGNLYGSPWEMVSSWKARQVQKMGETWCREYGWTGLCRVDAVGVVLGHDGDVEKIDHWENIC